MIKPCPFCGTTEDEGFDEGKYLRVGAHPNPRADTITWQVYCDACGAMGPERPSRELAASAWNTIGARRDEFMMELALDVLEE